MSNPFLSGRVAGFGTFLALACSLGIIGATFFVSLSGLDLAWKIAIYLGVAACYLAACAAYYRWQRARLAKSGAASAAAEENFTEAVEGRLLALEEASEFFGASLKPSDMFRLVASRVEEIVPFATCVLLMPSTDESFLRIKYAVGENAAAFMNFTGDVHRGLAARVLMSGEAQLDAKLHHDRSVFPAALTARLRSAAAVPLYHQDEVFAVLTIYAGEERTYDERAMRLFEAAAARVAPLFAGSLAFERNLSNALTDTLTELPNERALILVLENQIAESHRNREERPLTVLSIDIHNFAELNQEFGHATGDRILAYAAATIRKQLRQMDTLARAGGDEFLAVLPTAGEQIAGDVVERVRQALVSQPFHLGAGEMIHFHLNFGAATFWRDGETAAALLQHARIRKRQGKSREKSKVLWFPKEFVH